MTARLHRLTSAIAVSLATTPFVAPAQPSTGPAVPSVSAETPAALPADPTADLDTVLVLGRAQRLYRVQESSLATRTDTPLELVPQSVQVINRELIDDQAARQVTDLYRNISGISFFSYAGVTLRGFRQENVLYDGLRGDPYAGFSVPQLFNIQRVEVLKGPAGAAYGSGDPGGVINYATKKPTASTARQLRLEVGDDYRAASIEASGPLDAQGRVRYRVGGYGDHESPFRYNTGQDSRIADVGFAFDAGASGELLLQYTDLQQDLDANRLRGVPANDDGVFLADRRWNTNEPTDFLNLDARIALARYTASPSDRVDLDVAVRWFENSERQQYHESRGIAADGRTVWREFRDQARDVEGLTAAGHATVRFAAGAAEHTLLVGGEAFRLDSDFIGRTAVGVERGGLVPGLDLFDPLYGLSGAADYGLDTLPFRAPTRTRSRQDGLYVQDQVALGERWHVLGGLRWDRFEDENRVDGSRVDGNDLTWRLGATFEATDAVNLYASTATGFLPQAAGSQNPLAGGPFDPERSRQWEIGAKSSLAGGRIALNGAVYRIERSNVVQGTGLDAGNDGVDDLAALGLVRSEGVELDLLADLTERWVLNVAYGYNDARVVQGDPAAAGNTAGAGSDRFANAPRHTVGLWTRYDLPVIASSIAFGADHVGGRVSLDGQAVKAYTIFDASWQTQWRDWTFQANVKNLFDKVYAASGFIERTGHFPGEPRRVYLQARYNF